MSFHWGPTLRRSDDAGATWTEKDEAPVAFPEGAGASVARIWQLAAGPIDEPDVVYAGVEPAALFRSSAMAGGASARRGALEPPAPPAVGTRAVVACACTPSWSTPGTPTP